MLIMIAYNEKKNHENERIHSTDTDRFRYKYNRNASYTISDNYSLFIVESIITCTHLSRPLPVCANTTAQTG